MRILHVNKFLYRRGGAESYMQAVGELQADVGHDVEFFGTDHPLNDEHTYSKFFPRYSELNRRSTSRVDRARGLVGMFWNREAATGFDQVLGHFRPDVVHLHNIYHHLSPSILRPAQSRRIPMVMTLHDYKLACPTYLFVDQAGVCEACLDGKFRHALSRRCKDGSVLSSGLLAMESRVHTSLGAYDPVARFICPSRFMMEKMDAAGVFPQRLLHIPHFVDLSDQPASPTPEEGPVTFVGRLSREKGADVLLRAMASIKASAPLRIVGTGPLEAELRELASMLDVDARFVGQVDRKGVETAIREAAVVVVPSVVHENQPMVVLEALGLGRPVIGTSLGGVTELIRPGIDGLIVPPSDSDALAHAIEQLLAQPSTRSNMGRAGRDRVRSDFDPILHLRRIEHAYMEAGA